MLPGVHPAVVCHRTAATACCLLAVHHPHRDAAAHLGSAWEQACSEPCAGHCQPGSAAHCNLTTPLLQAAQSTP